MRYFTTSFLHHTVPPSNGNLCSFALVKIPVLVKTTIDPGIENGLDRLLPRIFRMCEFLIEIRFCQSFTNCVQGGLRAISQVKFRKDVAYMEMHRSFTDY